MFENPHRQHQCTLQLVFEDRALFVSVDLHVSLCKQQQPKCDSSICLEYPTSICKHLELEFFDVLLTLHLSIILAIDQHNAQILVL